MGITCPLNKEFAYMAFELLASRCNAIQDKNKNLIQIMIGEFSVTKKILNVTEVHKIRA